MLEALFNDIELKIKTDCTFVKHVGMYQSQDLFEEQNTGYPKTAVFVAYQNIQCTDLSNYRQQVDLEVVIKLVVEERTKNYFKALQQKNLVVQSLQYFNNLTRIGETIDTNPSGLYVYEIVFTTAFIEDLEPEPFANIGGTSGLNWNFDLGLAMDANNDGIATTWESSSGLTWSAGVFYSKDYLEQTFTNQYSVTVIHNWNRKPWITIIDIFGNVLDGEVQYINDDLLLVNFIEPESGKIIIQS